MVLSFILTDLFHLIFSRSIHVVTNGSISSFLMAEEYSIVYVYHIFFIQSSVKRHFGCLHVLATMNNPAVSIEVQICIFEFFE